MGAVQVEAVLFSESALHQKNDTYIHTVFRVRERLLALLHRLNFLGCDFDDGATVEEPA